MRTARTTDGVVHDVDTINRELAARVGEHLVTFDIPPDCVVTLRGERVKFRMVQAGDIVRVTYDEVRGDSVARVVEIYSGHRPSRFSP